MKFGAGVFNRSVWNGGDAVASVSVAPAASSLSGETAIAPALIGYGSLIPKFNGRSLVSPRLSGSVRIYPE